MAILQPHKPLVTQEPVLLVENRLNEGVYRFRLRVIDDEGNVSDPDERVVEVGKARVRPTNGNAPLGSNLRK